jgi:hypothetical protein
MGIVIPKPIKIVSNLIMGRKLDRSIIKESEEELRELLRKEKNATT